MSALVAASIASIVSCESRGEWDDAFVKRSTRDYPADGAGMQRAVCSDAGRVQKCVCAQPWL